MAAIEPTLPLQLEHDELLGLVARRSFHEAPVLLAIIEAHRSMIGQDYEAYRGHALRVRALALALGWKRSDELLQIAAATHDIGVWTRGTVDYLSPSADIADGEAMRRGLRDEERQILREAILNHHKLTSVRGGLDACVELFRQADWIDVTRGRLCFGLPKRRVDEIRLAIPDAGFQKMLRQLLLRSWRERPWRFPPMMRL